MWVYNVTCDHPPPAPSPHKSRYTPTYITLLPHPSVLTSHVIHPHISPFSRTPQSSQVTLYTHIYHPSPAPPVLTSHVIHPHISPFSRTPQSSQVTLYTHIYHPSPAPLSPHKSRYTPTYITLLPHPSVLTSHVIHPHISPFSRTPQSSQVTLYTHIYHPSPAPLSPHKSRYTPTYIT